MYRIGAVVALGVLGLVTWPAVRRMGVSGARSPREAFGLAAGIVAATLPALGAWRHTGRRAWLPRAVTGGAGLTALALAAWFAR